MRRFAMIAAALLIGGTAQAATDYPTRPVSVIVPFAAGGPTDTVARLVAESMSQTLGQQLVVENVGGAGGTLGAARVAKADPDGYTLLLHHIGQATSVSLYRKLAYDPATAFAGVGLITDVPMTVVGKSDLQPGSIGELLDYIREKKDDVTYAHAGIGSASHLCGMLLQDALKAQMTTVPYKGTGPAMTDLLGGQVDLLCDQSTTAVPQIQGGTIKAHAVTSRERLDVIKDVPTMAELGFPNFEFVIWHGLYAPAGTPKEAVETLNKALQVALDSPTVRARFGEVGTQVFAAAERSPQAHRARLEKEVATWRDVIAKAGISAVQ